MTEKEFFVATSKLIFSVLEGGGCQMDWPKEEDFQAKMCVQITLEIVFKVVGMTGVIFLLISWFRANQI